MLFAATVLRPAWLMKIPAESARAGSDCEPIVLFTTMVNEPTARFVSVRIGRGDGLVDAVAVDLDAALGSRDHVVQDDRVEGVVHLDPDDGRRGVGEGGHLAAGADGQGRADEVVLDDGRIRVVAEDQDVGVGVPRDPR